MGTAVARFYWPQICILLQKLGVVCIEADKIPESAESMSFLMKSSHIRSRQIRLLQVPIVGARPLLSVGKEQLHREDWNTLVDKLLNNELRVLVDGSTSLHCASPRPCWQKKA